MVPLQLVSPVALCFQCLQGDSSGRRYSWSLEAQQTELQRGPRCSLTDNTLTLFTLIQK